MTNKNINLKFEQFKVPVKQKKNLCRRYYQILISRILYQNLYMRRKVYQQKNKKNLNAIRKKRRTPMAKPTQCNKTTNIYKYNVHKFVSYVKYIHSFKYVFFKACIVHPISVLSFNTGTII